MGKHVGGHEHIGAGPGDAGFHCTQHPARILQSQDEGEGKKPLLVMPGYTDETLNNSGIAWCSMIGFKPTFVRDTRRPQAVKMASWKPDKSGDSKPL